MSTTWAVLRMYGALLKSSCHRGSSIDCPSAWAFYDLCAISVGPFCARKADGDMVIRTMPVLFENGNVEGKTRGWESEL